MESYNIYRYALCHVLKYRPKLAVAIFNQFYEDIEYLFKADPGELLRLGFKTEIIEQLKSPGLLRKAESHLDWYRRNGIEIVDFFSRRYPPLLKEIEDAPPLFMIRGQEDIDWNRCISIVGTRQATGYGMAACRTIVRKLARLDPRPVIVSGLAYGLDAEAHRSAIACGLKTVGIAGTGPERIYPTVNRPLYSEVQQSGAVIWEFDYEEKCHKANFLQRNRIIAGISGSTIVVESDIEGGSMNTASLAYSYNRNVFALPGRVSDRFSSGCNLLIERKVAEIINSTDALIHSINWTSSDKNSYLCSVKDVCSGYTDPEILQILKMLENSGASDIYGIQNQTGMNLDTLTAHLLRLMEDGKVSLDFKNEYSLCELQEFRNKG